MSTFALTDRPSGFAWEEKTNLFCFFLTFGLLEQQGSDVHDPLAHLVPSKQLLSMHATTKEGLLRSLLGLAVEFHQERVSSSQKQGLERFLAVLQKEDLDPQQ